MANDKERKQRVRGDLGKRRCDSVEGLRIRIPVFLLFSVMSTVMCLSPAGVWTAFSQPRLEAEAVARKLLPGSSYAPDLAGFPRYRTACPRLAAEILYPLLCPPVAYHANEKTDHSVEFFKAQESADVSDSVLRRMVRFSLIL